MIYLRKIAKGTGNKFMVQFIEFLFEAFSFMAVPILLGMLVFLIVVLVIIVSVVKSIIRKITHKSESYEVPQSYTVHSTYRPKSKSVKEVLSDFDECDVDSDQTQSFPNENEETESKPMGKASQEAIVMPSKWIPTASKYQNQELKGLPAEFLAIRKKALNGDVDAQCECGRLYMNGYLVEEDTQEAVYWYNKAAQQGSVEGHFQLGEYFADDYYENEGEIRYFEEARHHLLIAAKENHKTSQNSLAMLYCYKYTHYCEEKGLTTKEQREADPVYLDYVKKHKYWKNLFYMYNGVFSKEYNKDEQDFIE